MPEDGKKICEQCNESYYVHELKCPSCDYENRPNVALAALKKPKLVLEKRYKDALQHAEQNGNLKKIKEFESLIKSSAKAVVNLDIDILDSIINSNMRYINTYQLQEIRTLTKHPDDARKRAAVDGFLFPNFGRKITFAALSLDGKGIRQYGNSTVVLKEKMIAYRASLLEEDSIQFFNQSGKMEAERLNGYIATWEDKHKLAVAKLADRTTPDDTPDTFVKILLDDGDGKNMADTKFIEIHVFGFFNEAAIESFSYFDEAKLSTNARTRKKQLRRIEKLKAQLKK